jgi:hypothetical protein
MLSVVLYPSINKGINRNNRNCIVGAMVSVDSNTRWVKPKTAKYAVLRSNSKDWSARNQFNESIIVIISSSVICSRHDIAEALLFGRYTTITHSFS